MLTPVELKTLSFIAGYNHVHGYPPSLRELRDALGIPGMTEFYPLLTALEHKGLVTYTSGKSRTLQVGCVERGGQPMPLVSVY